MKNPPFAASSPVFVTSTDRRPFRPCPGFARFGPFTVMTRSGVPAVWVAAGIPTVTGEQPTLFVSSASRTTSPESACRQRKYSPSGVSFGISPFRASGDADPCGGIDAEM
jgi:hypothetical protein